MGRSEEMTRMQHGVEITLTVNEKDLEALNYSHGISSEEKKINKKVVKMKRKAS